MNVDIEPVVRALLEGELAIVPTETVYGVAGLATESSVLEKLRTLKGDRGDKPFPVQVPLGYDLESLVQLSPLARQTLEGWPGPLTVVLPLKASLPGLQGTIGLRCPDHPVMQAILARTGPLAVPSANRSGQPPPTTYAEAVAALAPVELPGVDGGPGTGTPSRVVRVTETIEVLRR